MAGMIGATIGNRKPSSRLIVKFSAESFDRPRVKATKWPSGFSRQTGMSFPVTPCVDCKSLQVDEVDSPTEIKKRENFDKLIERRWGTSINPPKVKDENENDPNDPHPDDWDYYENDDEAPRTIPDIEDTVDSKGKLLNQQPAYDRLINSEVQLQLREELHTAKVVQRAIGPDGITVGEYDENPIMNSIVYEVEFPDGQVKEYSAKVIAENMLSQVDSDGFSTSLMDAIVDYRKDEATAVQKADAFVVTVTSRPKETT
jgi:hypothetical protein